MKKLFLFLTYILFVFCVFSQEDKGYVEVKGTVKYDRQGLLGSKVDVIENGTKKGTFPVDSKGKFLIKIDLNKDYDLIVNKQDFYSKIISINTSLPPEDVGVWVYPFSVELLPMIEGFDASLLKEPFGKIKFSDEYGEFEADMDYTKSMKKKLDAMMREYERLKKLAWEKVVAQADEAFNNGDYDLATTLYDKAIDLDPYDPYPDDQIYAIRKIQSKDKNAQKNYDKAVALADKMLAEGDRTGAKGNYNKALKYLNKQYPKDQIALIDEYLNNQAAMDADAAAKEKAYAEAIAAGDRLFVSKQYQLSLEKFTTATGIKPTEIYPKDKIAEINTIMAQLANDAKNKEAIEKAYREAIAVADTDFGTKNYSNARVNYVKASQIKPVETYPRTKINEIDNLLAASKSLDEKYNAFISLADKAFVAKQYESAKNSYQQALSVKAGEAYPTGKIKEIDALLLALKAKGEKEKDAAYQQAIAQGDVTFNQQDYKTSKGFYTQALSIKPNETYPKQKIVEIDALLAEQAAKKRAYDMAIAQADNEFNAESYETAKLNYQKAIGIFPNEQYPQSRLSEIENILLAQKSAKEQKAAREKAYNEAIAAADAFFNQKKYQEAKNSYSQAAAVKPKELYPPKRIAEIDQLILAQKALEEKYKAIVATADNHFLNEKYNDAKTTYNNALQVKPNETYPKQKITEIDALLAQMAMNKAKRAEIQKKFDALIVQADAQYDEKNWDQAKQIYNQAIIVKGDEVYPKQRITDIDNMLAQIANKNKSYNDAIATADNLFNTKSYGESMAFYNQALAIKSNEVYPKQKIAEINKLLEELRKNEAAYDQYISLADKAFTNNKLHEAKGQYQAAQAIKPNELYPKKRIGEIDALIAEQARLQEEKEATYNAKMQQANSLFGQKNYTGSLTVYQQASQIKPNEQLPKQKIAELNGLIADMQKKEAAYDQFITLADQAFTNNKLQEAKGQYQSALSVKPEEAYPKKRINEIDALLTEQTRLKAEKEKLDAQYNTLISNADQLFNQNKYNEAKSSYQQAIQLKPIEHYPKGKIAEINNILETIDAQESAYKAKMQEADGLFNSKNLNGALTAYKHASQIKPNEQLPKQKIAEIQGLLAQQAKNQKEYDGLISQADALFNNKDYADAKSIYQNALMIMQNENYPKNQITKIDQFVAEQERLAAEQKALNDKYNQKITQADKSFASKDFDNAISFYMDAKGIKTTETYPDQQIAKINQLIQADKAKVEAAYKQAISKGDQFVSQEQYNEAKGQYQAALQIKPNDAIAQAKLVDVENLIAQDNAEKARLAEINTKYNNFIKQGDNAFKVKDYQSALAMYKSAMALKPAERYPKDQIEACEKKMREQQALIAAAEEQRLKDEKAAAAKSFEKDEFDYKGEKRDRQFLNELAKLYPEGITEENYNKPNKKIKRIIVNRGGIAKEYIEVKYSYGTFYFRNGQNISRGIFYSETKK